MEVSTGHRQTEQVLGDLAGMDTWDGLRILDVLVAGQERAIAAVRAALPAIDRAATLLAERLEAGARLIYAGAGTSIRIGVQDGSELPETFGLDAARVTYLIAGGRDAMFETAGAGEDDVEAGEAAAQVCRPGDVMIAVAASGSTPYTLAAARAATARGATLIAVVNNPDSPLGQLAHSEIVLRSGPEVIAGSTRMGAGTAQKAALNLLSTLAFIKCGAVHDGLMVEVDASNAKLKRRAEGIVAKIAGVAPAEAAAALDQAGGAIKPAVLLCAGAQDPAAARELLAETGYNLRLALARLAAA